MSNEPQTLPFVLGFSRVMCYPCAFKCDRTYDEMFNCYKTLLIDLEHPDLKEAVTQLLAKCEELNRP